MTITVEYKGQKLKFAEEPTDEEIEDRYQTLYGAIDATFTASRSPSLEREEGPYTSSPLQGRTIAVRTTAESELREPLLDALSQLGAELVVPEDVAEAADRELPRDPSLHGLFDRSVEWTFDSNERTTCHGLVFDGSTIDRVADLRATYQFLQRGTDVLADCGRILFLRRPPEAVDSPAFAATQQGLDSTTRGIAKEFGNQGGKTSNLLTVRFGAEDRLYRPLSYFLSDRSAYVTAQPLEISATLDTPPDGPVDENLFDGKTALVTGATRGIGRATAAQFAQEGARVICVGRPGSDRLEEVEDEFGGIPLGLDVCDSDAPSRVADVARDHGGLDILVHNAGIAKAEESIDKLDYELWKEIRSVNLDAAVEITNHLLEEDLLNEWGRIFCTSSVNGLAGAARISYSTSKAGHFGFVQHCAERVADKNIAVNAVVPGVIETSLYDTVPMSMREMFGRVNALVQPGFPSDVANAYTFLASPGAQGITGESLRICGEFIIGA